MDTWCVELREDGMSGWSWICHDPAGRYLCSSKCNFPRCWQALRDFERQLGDHIAVMFCRSPSLV